MSNRKFLSIVMPLSSCWLSVVGAGKRSSRGEMVGWRRCEEMGGFWPGKESSLITSMVENDVPAEKWEENVRQCSPSSHLDGRSHLIERCEDDWFFCKDVIKKFSSIAKAKSFGANPFTIEHVKRRLTATLGEKHVWNDPNGSEKWLRHPRAMRGTVDWREKTDLWRDILFQRWQFEAVWRKKWKIFQVRCDENEIHQTLFSFNSMFSRFEWSVFHLILRGCFSDNRNQCGSRKCLDLLNG